MKKYNQVLDELKLKKIKTDFPRAQITSSKDAFEYMAQFYSDDIEIYESFFLLLLNKANNTTGFVKISQGGTAGTVIDIKLIVKYAIENLSCSVIVCHNHPSGEVSPSREDIITTERLQESGKILGIPLLDHIIFCENDFLSLKEKGHL